MCFQKDPDTCGRGLIDNFAVYITGLKRARPTPAALEIRGIPSSTVISVQLASRLHVPANSRYYFLFLFAPGKGHTILV